MLIGVYLLIGLLILAVCYELGRISGCIGVAKQLGTEASIFTRPNPAATKRVLIVGDSTSYGTGTSAPHASLAGRLSADLPDHALDNFSENAMSLGRLVQKLQSIEGPYDRTFIHIGGVDTLTLTPEAKIRTQLREALGRSRSFTRGPVYLVSVDNTGAKPAFHFPFSWLLGRRSEKVSRISAEESAALGVTHIPLWRSRAEDPLAREGARVFARDGIHPNDDGYALQYQMIKQAL